MYRLTLCKQAGDVILRLQRLFPWNEKSKMSKEMNMVAESEVHYL